MFKIPDDHLIQFATGSNRQQDGHRVHAPNFYRLRFLYLCKWEAMTSPASACEQKHSPGMQTLLNVHHVLMIVHFVSVCILTGAIINSFQRTIRLVKFFRIPYT